MRRIYGNIFWQLFLCGFNFYQAYHFAYTIMNCLCSNSGLYFSVIYQYIKIFFVVVAICSIKKAARDFFQYDEEIDDQSFPSAAPSMIPGVGNTKTFFITVLHHSQLGVIVVNA